MATHIHTCPLCEATCGLRIETDNGNVVSVRGDEEDVFSRGFLCPKAHGLKALHEDPDRLRQPLVRRDGELREATWAEAWQAVEDGLAPLLEQHGRNAVAVYLGNPSAHNLSANVYAPGVPQGARLAERLHGEHRRPDAEAGRRRADVRRDAHACRCRTSTAASTCSCSERTRSSRTAA